MFRDRATRDLSFPAATERRKSDLSPVSPWTQERPENWKGKQRFTFKWKGALPLSDNPRPNGSSELHFLMGRGGEEIKERHTSGANSRIRSFSQKTEIKDAKTDGVDMHDLRDICTFYANSM